MSCFCVYGLQRSGTNFVQQLLKQNSKTISIGCGRIIEPECIWKHGYDIENFRFPWENGPPPAERLAYFEKVGHEMNCIFIYKHPYSWIESVTQNPFDIGEIYTEVSSFTQDKKDKYKIGKLNIIKLAELHKKHSKYWFSLMKTKQIYHIQYEKLIESLSSTKDIVKDIFKEYNISLNNKDVVIPTKVPLSNTFDNNAKEKYTDLKITKLSWNQIQKINEVLDPNVIAQQGYKLITSKDEYNKHRI